MKSIASQSQRERESSAPKHPLHMGNNSRPGTAPDPIRAHKGQHNKMKGFEKPDYHQVGWTQLY